MFIPINLTLSIYPTPLLAMVQFGPMACFLEIAERGLEVWNFTQHQYFDM